MESSWIVEVGDDPPPELGGSCSELCVDEVSCWIFGAGGLRMRLPVSQASRRDFQRSGPIRREKFGRGRSDRQRLSIRFWNDDIPSFQIVGMEKVGTHHRY